MFNKITKFIKFCRETNSDLISVCFNSLPYYKKGRPILVNNNVFINGIKNIKTDYPLMVGFDPTGFTNKKDTTILNVKGLLYLSGSFKIGRGVRIDIGENAECHWGKGAINPFTIICIQHKLIIGDGCAISWNCQILDDDFHTIQYEGVIPKKNEGIHIGENVWIGSNVSILKGAIVPNGSVVAANSVVTSVFEGENLLIGGCPAKILKTGVKWF